MLGTLNIAAADQGSPPQHWNELSIHRAQNAMAEGQFSAHDLTTYYLQRITALNNRGPQLRAVIETNPHALKHAAALDAERARGELRSPLHGLPVLLKANIATAGALETTAGSLALHGFHAHRDAQLVAQLRAAGLVILGTANLSEWANFRDRHSASGWSSIGGQTRNPYVLNRTPCGSSSGSGVAVSANLTMLAVGTETNGSIMCPAAMNSIAGIKPTIGAVPSDGIIPIASSQDIAGPMARSVADAAALLQAMLSEVGRQQMGDGLYQHARSDVRLDQIRLGVVTAYADDGPRVHKLLQQAAGLAREHGAEIVEIDTWQLGEQVFDDSYQVLLYEFKRDLNRWLETFQHPNNIRQLSDLMAFNREHAATVMPFFGQSYWREAQALDLEARHDDWRLARQNSRQAARTLIDETLRKHKLDAILLPSYSLPWLIDHVDGDHFSFGTSSAAAIAGYPSVTFPAGYVSDLPVGLSLIGGMWQDRNLIGWAAALEQHIAARRPPKFIPSVEMRHSAPLHRQTQTTAPVPASH